MKATDLHYSSHLPLLMRAVRETSGPILELGTGFCSTPVLHWLCLPTQRRLVSYESVPKWVAKMEPFRALPWHELTLVEDWDQAPIEQDDVTRLSLPPHFRRAVRRNGMARGLATKPLMQHLSTLELSWLLAGGLCSTGGVAFYLWKSRPYTHAIWHVFVFAGVACHFVTVLSVTSG